MKRTVITMLLALFTVTAAFSQTRAAGLRLGHEIEFSYQHQFGAPHFMELDLGLDTTGANGFELTGTYNWVVAEPLWTMAGEWSVYLGPGASLGYVYDSKGTVNDHRAEMMVGLALQVGIEWCIWDRLGLSVDLRPIVGYHFGSGHFYRGGMNGFIPSLGVRYRF